MYNNKTIQTFFVLVLSCTFLSSAYAAWPVLNNADMQKFVQSFPAMYSEYKALGLDVNPQTGQVDGSDRLMWKKEVQRILNQNGWDFRFWGQLQAITRGYALLKHQQFQADHGADSEQFVNSLRKSPWLTPEKKAELERFYSSIKDDVASKTGQWGKQVNPNDLEIIRSSMVQLESVMTEVVKYEWDQAVAKYKQPEQALPSGPQQAPQAVAEPVVPQPGDHVRSEVESRSLASLLLPVPAVTSKKSKTSEAHIEQILCSVNSPRGSAKKITIIRRDGGRIDWSPQEDVVAIDRKAPGNYYNVFLMSPDGTLETCLTCDTGGVLAKGHHGQPVWHPSGNYLVFQSQKKDTVGNWGRDLAATPGFGQFCDLWLWDIRANRFYQLTHTDDTNKTGVLHPHFSHDGTRLTWSQMYEKTGFMGIGAGNWKLKVADFSFQNTIPTLTNERSFEPGCPSFLENHGTSPDDRKLIFTGSFEWDGKGDWFKSTRIYLLDMNTNQLQKLTYDPTWNEHALYNPASGRIVWMTGRENTVKGTDYWSMNPDGSDKRRITDYNNAALPSHMGKTIVSADSSFNPDGTKLLAYLQTDLVTQDGLTVLIECDKEGCR